MNKSVKITGIALVLALVLTGCMPTAGAEVVNVAEVVQDVNIREVHESIKEQMGENYIPDMIIDQMMLETAVGITEDEIKELEAEMSDIGDNADMIIIVKASEGHGDIVESKLTDYKNEVVENAHMYPMDIAKVYASQVVRHNDDIYFIMLGAHDDRPEVNEEEALEFATYEVNKVKEIISGFYK